MGDEKYCLYCGEPLVRKDGETKQNYNNRETCDRYCAAARKVELNRRK